MMMPPGRKPPIAVREGSHSKMAGKRTSRKANCSSFLAAPLACYDALEKAWNRRRKGKGFAPSGTGDEEIAPFLVLRLPSLRAKQHWGIAFEGDGPGWPRSAKCDRAGE